MKNMHLKQKFNSAANYVKKELSMPLGFAVLYTAAAVCVSTAEIGLEAGIEAMFRKPQEQYEAKVVEIGYHAGMNTKADFGYVNFQKADGQIVHLMDGQSVLDGKLFTNTVIPKLKVGDTYIVTQRDDLSSKLVDAVPINK